MSISKQVNGLIAAPLTGYHPDGSVNLDIVTPYANMLHANGVAGAFVNGTTGEGLSLSLSERCTLAEHWVKAAPDGFMIIIHVGHTCQAESRMMADHACRIGANAIAEIGPVFFRPASVGALVDYCSVTAAAAPELPYYYYHMPSMNQVQFPMAEFLEIASLSIPNLAGIKYTHEDLADYERCRTFENGKFDVLFGRDEILFDALNLGARGAVGSTYNAIAPLYLSLINAFHSGSLIEARSLQAISADFCRILSASGGFGSALKSVMSLIGLDLGLMRRPQLNLSVSAAKQLETTLRQTGALEYLNK